MLPVQTVVLLSSSSGNIVALIVLLVCRSGSVRCPNSARKLVAHRCATPRRRDGAHLLTTKEHPNLTLIIGSAVKW